MSVTVSRSEGAMLRAVRAVLRAAPPSELWQRLFTEPELPDRISPGAATQLRRDLSKGLTEALVHRGAWRPHRAWIDGRAVDARMFQLRPELSLTLSAATFELCRWLTGAPTRPSAPRTAADELLFYLAADALRRLELPLGDLASSALVRLGLAAWVTSEAVPIHRRDRWGRRDEDTEPRPLAPLDADAWPRVLGPDGCVILEALQPDLAKLWILMERRKGAALDPHRLAAMGARQAEALGPFLDGVEATRRFDLATFLVDAAVELVDRPARAWTGGIRRETHSVRARAEASRGAAAYLSALSRLATWRDQLSTVPFYEDDEYGAAQLLLARWERLGRAGFRSAASLADQLHAARVLSGGESDDV